MKINNELMKKIWYIAKTIFSKNNLKNYAYFFLGALVIYGILWISTPKIQPNVDVQKKLDSLNIESKKLIAKQKTYDSLKSIEQKKLIEVEEKINNIKEKTTIIKEYYYEKGQIVNKFNTRQLDSFFSNRYGY